MGRLEGNVNYLECLRGKGVDVPVIADDDSVSDPDTLYYPDSDDVEAGTPVQGSAMAPNHTEAEAPRGTQKHPEAPRQRQTQAEAEAPRNIGRNSQKQKQAEADRDRSTQKHRQKQPETDTGRGRNRQEQPESGADRGCQGDTEKVILRDEPPQPLAHHYITSARIQSGRK